MYKKIKPQAVNASVSGPNVQHIAQFPHCDPRVLHAPGECEVCGNFKEWQELRIAWGIAFTGWTPDEKELPCPADHARGDNHQKWPGNVPSKA